MQRRSLLDADADAVDASSADGDDNNNP